VSVDSAPKTPPFRTVLPTARRVLEQSADIHTPEQTPEGLRLPVPSLVFDWRDCLFIHLPATTLVAIVLALRLIMAL